MNANLHPMLSKSKLITPDIFIYVNFKHGIKTSLYLVPPAARLIHLIIEDEKQEPKVIEFLDRQLRNLRVAETTEGGQLTIPISEFKEDYCYLRLVNGRLLCFCIDKWPDLLPPFLANSG